MRACPFCNFDEGWIHETTYKSPMKFKVKCKICGAEGPESNSREMALKKWDGLLSNIHSEDKFKEVLNEWQHELEDQLIKPLSELLAEEPQSKNAEVVEDQNQPQPKEEDGSEDKNECICTKTDAWWKKIHDDDDKTCKHCKKLIKTNLDEDAMGGVSAPMSTLNNVPGVGSAQPASTAATTSAQFNSPDSTGSGDKWDSSVGKIHVQEGLNENNINPHDKIGVMLAKAAGVPLAFEKGDGDSEIKQKTPEEASHRIMDYTEYANMMVTKKVDEAIKIKGAEFDLHDVGKFGKVLAGRDGMLADRGVLVPWNFIMELFKKYIK